jgi:hypothetical protein
MAALLVTVSNAAVPNAKPAAGQRFVSIHDPIVNLFHILRHDIPSDHHRELHATAMNLWATIARA